MAGLIDNFRSWTAALQRWRWCMRGQWKTLVRRYGWAGVALSLGGLVLGGCALLLLASLQRFYDAQEVARLGRGPSVPAAVTPPSGQDRERLAAFDALLLPPDDVSAVVRDLLSTAQARNLPLARGEYSREPDPQGGFERVRLSFPVRGDSEAIHVYIQNALKDHPVLALENLQLKRERSDAREIDARIRWVLFVRQTPGAPQRMPNPDGGRQ